MACFVIRSSCGILPKVWQPQAVHCASYESFDLCSTTSIVGSLQSGQKVGRISIATSERERLNTVRLARIRKRNNSPSELIPSQTVSGHQKTSFFGHRPAAHWWPGGSHTVPAHSERCTQGCARGESSRAKWQSGARENRAALPG